MTWNELLDASECVVQLWEVLDFMMSVACTPFSNVSLSLPHVSHNGSKEPEQTEVR